MKECMVTQEILKSRLHYDPETGIFTWIKSNNSSISKGEVAGTLNHDGYIQIGINKKYYLAHRLAVLYMTGEFPEFEVDHIDHDRTKNNWENLRKVTGSENSMNLSVDVRNSTGVTGVYKRKTGKPWVARITVNRKEKYLGSFVDFDDAVEARKTAEVKYGFHKNHGNNQLNKDK
jgi:hypothetical protein